MKYIVGLFSFVFSFTYSFAQPADSVLLKQRSTTDSLKIVLANSGNDTERADLCRKIGWQFVWTIPDSALKYASLGQDISDRANLPEIKIDLLNVTAQALASKGNFSQALAKTFVGLDLSEKLRNDSLIVWAYASIGAIYFLCRGLSECTFVFFEAPKISGIL